MLVTHARGGLRPIRWAAIEKISEYNAVTKGVENQHLNRIFKSHFICGIQRSLWKTQILDAFAGYVDESSFKEWHLCLYKFATVRPLTFVRWEAVDEALAFFNQYPVLTLDGIAALQRELSHATFSLLRPGASWNKEEKLSLDRPEQMAEFESIWHPEYQRYCEHVFNHLIQLPLHVIGTRKRKNYLAQTLANRANLLQTNGFAELATGYDSVVRNAISHGSTSFEITGVQYIDKKGDRLLAAWEFTSLFDSLVDTCHSILVALLLFLCEQQTLVEGKGLQKLPLGLRFIFIDAFSSHSGFKLLSAMESDTAGPKSQLNIVCKINSKARWAQMFEGMHTCWNASSFGGENYNRFFVSFDCGMPVLSSLILNGDELQRAIKTNEVFNKCASKIVETSLLWYDASRLERKLYSWKSILPVRWQNAKKEIIESWRDGGLKVLSSRYTILETLNRSTEKTQQLEAHIVLHEKGVVTDELLQEIVRHAIRRLRKHRVRRTDLHGEKGRARKPDCVRVRLYAQDRRIRTLMSYGWKDKDLVLIAEWISYAGKMQPFYTREADTVLGRIRIKYNPNLVQTAAPQGAS